MNDGSPTGFVGFQQWLDANQDKAREMAQQAGGQVVAAGGQGGAAGAEDSQRAAGMLGSTSGTQALLQNTYGKQGATGLDAALAGGAGGDYFTQLQKTYGNAAGDRQNAQAAQTKQKGIYAAQNQAANAKAYAAQSSVGKAAVNPSSEANKMRAEDAARHQNNAVGDVNSMTREQWANMHGLSLEQWIQNGKQPSY